MQGLKAQSLGPGSRWFDKLPVTPSLACVSASQARRAITFVTRLKSSGVLAHARLIPFPLFALRSVH